MADVSSTLAGWSSTSASNNPQGTTTVGTGVDDNLKEIQGVIVRGLSHKGADIASASTTDLGAIEGLMHDITGTTTITSFGTVRVGVWKILKFEGALTLTHNATSLILPAGTNIQTADGDVGVFMSEGSGNWRCLTYQGNYNDPAGRIEQYGGATAPTGWLECDGSAVSRATYARLFTAISTTWGVGDGSTTFNLPDFRGRVLVGKGTGTLAASGVNADVDTAADTLTVASNNTTWITGMAVVFTLASGTITGLTSGNTYYIIRSSSTLVKLASSLANAQNGTAVDMTAKSSPVWTITYTLTARALAEKGGEESHAMSSTELLAHTHEQQIDTAGSGFGGSNQFNATPADAGYATLSTGGNTAMNTMQCYGVTMFIIRT